MMRNYLSPDYRSVSKPGRNSSGNPTGLRPSPGYLRVGWIGALFMLLFFLAGQNLTAQTVTIGSGTNVGNKYPVVPYFWYSYGQQIVNKSEINTAGSITKLRFYSTGNALVNSNNWTIYLGHTSKTAFANNTDWIPASSMTQVFSGTVTAPATAGWMEISLLTPFAYNNSDNLVVSVDENASNYNETSSTNYFRIFTASPNNRGIYYQSDSTNPDPANMTSTTGVRTNYINQMQLDITPIATDIAATAITGIPAGNCPGASGALSVTLKNEGTSAINFGTNNATITLNVTGASTQTLTGTKNTGTLAPGATVSVNLSPNAAFSTSGTHNMTATVAMTGDGNASNNSISTSKTIITTTGSPYIQNFPTTSAPAGWNNTGFTIGASGHQVTTNGIYKNMWSSAATGQFNTIPVGPLAAGDELKFDYRILNYNTTYPGTETPPTGNWGNFKVQISTDCGATYTDLQTINSSNHTVTDQSFTTKTYGLSSYAGQYAVVRILATWNTGDYFLDFDNFSIAAPPACTPPAGLTVTRLTDTTASVSWTGAATAKVEWGASGCTAGAGATAGACGNIVSGSSPQIITGLTPNNTFSVNVRQDCTGSGKGFSTNATTSYFSLPSCPGSLGAGSVSIASLPYSVTNHTTCGNGNNVTSSNVAVLSGSANYYGGEDKTYVFTAPVNGTYSVVLTTASDQDAGIMLYHGCPYTPGSTSVGFAQNLNGLTRTILPTLTAGETYYLVVDNYPDPSCLTSYNLEINIPAPPACASGQVPANAATNVIRNSSLSWSSVSGATSYDVYFGTSSTPSFVTNQTSLSFTPPLMNANTQYHWQIVPKNANGDAIGCNISSFTTGTRLNYCTSNPSSNDAQGITNVLLNETNFPTGDVTYADYTATPVNVSQGQEVNLEVTFSTGHGYDANVWIDLNNDGDFTDAGELVVQGASTSDMPTTLVIPFTIPANATLGEHQMRIGSADSGQIPPAPCYSGSWGVTIDFILNVTPMSTDTPDYVNLQHPANANILAGESTTVYARVYEGGLTDTTSGAAPGIEAWIGISPAGSNTNPNTWTTWIPTTFNVETDGNNNDEYRAVIGSTLLPGTYYYASRFRLNGGPYTYGGNPFNQWDGTSSISGVLTVEPNPTQCAAMTSPANAATGVTVDTVALSWTAPVSGPAPTDYKVYFGTTSGSLTLQTTTSNLTYNATAPAHSTTYYWRVVPTSTLGGDAAACAEFSFTTQPSPFGIYCSDVDYTYNVEPITLVNFAGINNSSSAAINGTPELENFIAISGNVTTESSYQMTLKGNTDGNFTSYFRVFIDWNQDGDFNDANESFDGGSVTNSNGTDNKSAITTITVPATALAGTTRMRIKKVYSGSVPSSWDACTAAGYGQTEDYSLNVTICTPITWYADADGDGFGNAAVSQSACNAPANYVANSTDCNDGNIAVWRSALLYVDADGDGYDAGQQTICYGASIPAGYSLTSLGVDCNDANAAVWRSALLYVDADGDGHAAGQQTICYGASIPAGHSLTSLGEDCNDANAAIWQSALLYLDADGDGYDAGQQTICYGASIPAGYSITTNGGDCNDADATKHQTYAFYADNDGDSFGAGIAVMLCATDANTPPTAGYSVNNSDCDDTRNTVYPGATEIGYNLIDDNCDGSIDEGFPPKVTVIQGAMCNTILAAIDSQLVANIVAGAQGYRWRVTTMDGPNNGQVQFLNTQLRTLKLTQLASYAFNTKYKIEVAVYFAGYLQSFTESTCTVTTPAVSSALIACGQSLSNMSDVIYANLVPHATGYRFRISDPLNGGNTQEINRSLRDFRMTLVTNFQVQYGKTYNIEVAVRNTDGTYMPYGSVCSVTTPVFPSTSLQDSQCDDYAVPTAITQLFAYSYPGAIGYGFLLTGPGLPASGVEVVKSLRVFSLYDFPGLHSGATYNVRVRLIFNVNDPAGPHGKTCTIVTPGLSRTIDKPDNMFNAIAFPNPFADSFNLDVITSFDQDINVKVYDMTGRLLENKTVRASDAESVQIGDSYPSGVYNVIVNQGDNVKTLRVIKR